MIPVANLKGKIIFNRDADQKAEREIYHNLCYP